MSARARTLNDLRARRRARGRRAWTFDVSFAAVAWTSAALAATWGLNGSWGLAALGLLGGFIVLSASFVALGALFGTLLGRERLGDVTGFATTLGLLAWYCHGGWPAWDWLASAVGVAAWLGHGAAHVVGRRRSEARREALPADLEEALAALPKELDARLRGPVEQALADCSALQDSVLARRAPGPIDAAALVDDAHATLRLMADQAARAQEVVEALGSADSAGLRGALDAAVSRLGEHAARIREARETWLVFQTAGAQEEPAVVDRLRRNAEALRATAAAIEEIEREV